MVLQGFNLTEEMKEKIIDGKTIANSRNELLKTYCNQLKEDYCITPTLAIIQVGHNDASNRYVHNKKKKGNEIGIWTKEYMYEEEVETETLLRLICDLNSDETVHGILVQLPLPKHIDETSILNAIRPSKDVDGFHPVNIGKLHMGNKPHGRIPCTANGIIQLIKSTGEEINGKKAVVLGRSNIVGRPVAALLEQENATVTVCHSKTPSTELALAVRSADIVVSAIGKANYITRGIAGMNKVIIDVGINTDENGKLCGDVDFDGILPISKYITPVPGGVGPMTISCLMENVIRCVMNLLEIDQSDLTL